MTALPDGRSLLEASKGLIHNVSGLGGLVDWRNDGYSGVKEKGHGTSTMETMFL